ncbi:GH25 family lysozyme [Ruminococcus sp. YH-rum2234]|uniref:GH25 family lysozyme n=2 Tax=Fusibacillus kribbianus TaxID=3044208 RepID=A0AAP4BCB2_9FIRM|nr:GH25 family lysozyme [Ruminococcus sp. YH-rum2234]
MLLSVFWKGEIVNAERMTDLGNEPEIVMNGGRVVSDSSGDTWFVNESDGGIYRQEGESEILITKDLGEYLNYFQENLYYMVRQENGTVIRKRDIHTGESSDLFVAEQDAEQLYISGNQLYYLSAGRICTVNIQDRKLTVWNGDSQITSYIPLEKGYVYSKGLFPNRTIYYNGSLLLNQVGSYYVVQDHIILNGKEKTFQVNLSVLDTAKAASDAVEMYQEEEYAGSAVVYALNSDECGYCEDNAQNLQISNVISLTSTLNEGVSSAYDWASERQKNIVKRSRQMLEVQWTPQQDILGWESNYVFQKGKDYQGIPYGQPVRAKYVPWDAGFSEFVSAIQDVNSLMYTSYSDYNERAPYYSSDCSAFVSWAWNTNRRLTTSGIPGRADQVATQSVYNVLIGDAFVYPGNHSVLVYDVGYDTDGIMVYIDIAEQTPPQTKITRYGKGGQYTLENLQYRYLQNGYTLYRLKEQYDVSYTHDCAVPVDDECADCHKLTAPTINLVEQRGAQEIRIGWDYVEEADAYAVFRSEAETEGYQRVASVWAYEYIDSGLQEGKTYYYRITPMRYTGETWVSGESSQVIKVPLMTAPKEVVVSSSEEGNTITWSSVSNAEYYGIMRADSPEGSYSWLGAINGTSYIDVEANLEAGKAYYYKVYPARMTEFGWVNGPECLPRLTVAQLKAIQNVKTQPGSGIHAVKISWDTQENVSVYGILRSEAIDGEYQWLGAVNGQTYTDENLEPGKIYYYKIYGSILLNGMWYNGASSSAVSGQMIAAPDAVQVDSQGGNSLRVTWNSVDGAAGYAVYCSEKNGGELSRIAVVSQTEYIHQGLKAHDVRYYVIQTLCTVDGATGIGANTDYESGTVLMAAPAIQSIGPGGATNAIRLSWNSVVGASVYGVMRSESPDGEYQWLAAVGGQSYTDANLETGKTYYYKLYAAAWNNNTWLNGEMSETVSGQVCPGPQSISTEMASSTSLRISWSKVSGAAAYYVYRRQGNVQTFLGGSWETEYYDTGLQVGEEYSYVVQSVVYADNQYGLAGYSESQIQQVGLLKPEGVHATADGNVRTVSLQWTEVPGAQCYGIFRAVGLDGDYVWLGTSSSNSYEDKDCLPEQQYVYKVYAAVNINGSWINSETSEAYMIQVPRATKALGIDVSYHNGYIDWNQVAQTQVRFAMIRIGYRRNADGVIIEDVRAAENLQGALAAGLDVGVYFFSTAVTPQEAEEEARWVLNYIQTYNITYPVAYDCEGYDKTTSRMFGLSIEQRTSHAITFLDMIAENGYTPLMYGSKSYLMNSWAIDQLEQRYSIWVAQWPLTVPVYPYEGTTTYTRSYLMWQYTDRGSVSGITGNVDMDVIYY